MIASLHSQRPQLLRFLGLTALCLFTLALVNWLFADQIKKNQQEAALDLVRAILPEQAQPLLTMTHMQQLETEGQAFLQDCAAVSPAPKKIQLIKTQASGYNGILTVVTAIQHKSVAGVRVIPPQQETPGLGDQIMPQHSDWIEQFKGQVIPENFSAKTLEFDTITGATISTAAVNQAVQKAMQIVTATASQSASKGTRCDSL